MCSSDLGARADSVLFTDGPLEPRMTSVAVIPLVPLNTGLNADIFRVPFVAPSMAMKSSEAVDVAVDGRELMRMSAMLGDGYELIAATIDKTIPRTTHQVVDDVGVHRLRTAKDNVAPKLPVRVEIGRAHV